MFSVKAMEMILEGFRRIALEGPDARIDYLGEFVHASLFAGIAFLKAGCATVHGMLPSRSAERLSRSRHGESNYALFGKILRRMFTTSTSRLASWASSRRSLLAAWAAPRTTLCAP